MLSRITVSPALLENVAPAIVLEALSAHLRENWRNIGRERILAAASVSGGRRLSCHEATSSLRIVVITYNEPFSAEVILLEELNDEDRSCLAL
jgi:hypothetical protein